MQIHVVQPGQTLWSIGREYGVLPGLLARFNGLTEPYRLAVGQAILILRPESLYTVQPGDTVFRIAQKFSLTQNGLYRLNPGLSSQERLYPGQVLVTSIEDRPTEKTTLLGYAYPWANERTLRGILPYADTLVPFTYGFTEAGELVEPDDEGLLALAKEFGAKTLLHLSTLTEQGSFSAQRAGAVLGDDAARGALIQNTVRVMREKGFAGVDVDFEYLGRALAASYAAFLRELRESVHAAGGYLMAALAPKTSDDQPGVLYEGHDYAAIGQETDKILLMTYEWMQLAHKPKSLENQGENEKQYLQGVLMDKLVNLNIMKKHDLTRNQIVLFLSHRLSTQNRERSGKYGSGYRIRLFLRR